MKNEFPKLFPFISDIRQYRVKKFVKDINSALGVALLALPQSIAYSLVSNLPISSGIFAAIFGPILTGLFGSSRHLICGPATAVALLIQLGTSQILFLSGQELTGLERELFAIHIVTQLVFLIGIMQLLASLFKLDKITQFISRPVMLGYLTGVALTIIITQIPPFLGLSHPNASSTSIKKLIHLAMSISSLHMPTAVMGTLGLFMMIYFKRKLLHFPYPLIMIIICTFLLFFFSHLPYFQHFRDIEIIGKTTVQQVQFPLRITWPFLDMDLMSFLLPTAFAISMISLFEIHSIGRVISSKNGHLSSTNQDLFGLSISNLFSSLFLGTLPSTGSPSRSLLNLHLGAKSRFSAVFSGLFVLAFATLLKPFIAHIPITALSATLFMIAWNMVDFKALKICLNTTRADALVFIVTTSTCLLFQLDIAFYIGIILSIILFLKQSAHPSLKESVFNEEGVLKPIDLPEEREDDRIRIIHIDGNLFFGSSDILHQDLQSILSDPNVQVVILCFEHATNMDASTCFVLQSLLESKKHQQRLFFASELNSRTVQVFQYSGLIKYFGTENIFIRDIHHPMKSTRDAVEKAKKILKNTSNDSLLQLPELQKT